jgi:hypothetical protein
VRRTAKILALMLELTGTRELAAQPASERPLPPPPPPSDQVAGTEFKPGFVFATGRIPPKAPDPERVALEGNGELQFRATFLSDLPLTPFPGEPSTRTLGQEFRAEYWWRNTSRVTFGERLALIFQVDLRGFFAGQETRFVYSAEEPYSNRDALFVDARWLYLEYRSPTIVASTGLQGLHWGMGLLDNDGDHPALFGDYARGARHAVLLFVLRPGGKTSPFNVGAAGGIVFPGDLGPEPAAEDLREGRIAPEGVVAAFYDDGSDNVLGFYGVYRRWSREPENRTGIVYEETLDEFVVDSTGRFNAKIPGRAGFVFGEYEVAYRVGSSKVVRAPEPSPTEETADVDAIGAAPRLGAVATAGSGDERWGRVVAQLEWGWASGDANPNDDSLRRFSFDPNYNVGLVLFDQVLAFKTARASDIARYSGVAQRPNSGNDRLASNGAIFGTTYVYPSLVVRPVPELDLKAALLVAQATADFVDPVAAGLAGRSQNYDGGSTANRDLGLELDGGVEYRLPLGSRGTLELGAQGGVFFPGNAFADVAGVRMPTQYLAVLRLGLQY